MLPPPSRSLHLFAVVPAVEAATLEARTRRGSVLVCGAIAAVFGQRPEREDEVRAALRHDRIVGLAFDTCSSVVPFRLGIELGSEAELRSVLELNADDLSSQLARFRGRVEMGLKVQLATPSTDEPLRLPFGLASVRALAPGHEDRSERLARRGRKSVFEGCYLIPRASVEEFWRAVERIRSVAPEVPLLGSGPWAAYSFCDMPLRRAAAPIRSAMDIR